MPFPSSHPDALGGGFRKDAMYFLCTVSKKWMDKSAASGIQNFTKNGGISVCRACRDHKHFAISTMADATSMLKIPYF
jgi:hypothetical protein